MGLCLVTGDSVVIAAESQSGWTLEETAPDSGAQCVAVDPANPDLVYAGTVGRGVLCSPDCGRSWTAAGVLRVSDVYSLAVSPFDVHEGPGTVYAGTEPSALFRSEDGGTTWVELDGLQSIPSKAQWSFPPRPHTHHVRCIALSPHDPALILAGIELGGVMRSTDGGVTWEDHRRNAHRDCHWLVMHPKVPGRAYQAAGGGAAMSTNAGATWRRAEEGLDRWYAWGLAVDPDDPDLVYVSASPSPMHAHSGRHADAALYRWRGARWEAVGDGLAAPLAALPMAIVTSADGAVYAGLRDGSIFRSRDRGETWEHLPMPPLPTVLAIAILEI